MTIEERIAKYEQALEEWDADIEATERDETVDEASDLDLMGRFEHFSPMR
jgi:hypothetical protein